MRFTYAEAMTDATFYIPLAQAAEAEPGLRLAVCRQLLLGVPGLVGATPAAVGIDASAERVHDRVEVRTDP